MSPVPQAFMEGIMRAFDNEIAQGNAPQLTREEWNMLNTLMPYASSVEGPNVVGRIESAMKGMKEA